MSNLIDSLKGLVSNELVVNTASALGENENAISKAIHGILPVLLGGVLNSNTSNHSMLSDLLHEAGRTEGFENEIINGVISGNGSSHALGIGNGLIAGLFGSKSAGVSNLLSNYSGIKSSSSTALLGIGGSLIALFLGKKMASEGLHLSGILNWLSEERDVIENAMPSGFATFMQSSNSNQVSSSASDTEKKSSLPVSENEKGDGMKWLLPLLLLGLLGFGMWYWLKGCNKEGEQSLTDTKVENSANAVIDSAANSISAAADSAGAAVSAASDALKGKLDEAGNWIAEKGDSITIKLDNGVEINATKGCLEDRFVSFIKDPGAAAGKDIWFNFDDLLFESGKATLKPGSKTQLENTVVILKAYPKVKIKIGAYTDNEGDSVSNMKLSEARAKTVYNQLLNKGITKASFDEKSYEGYGSQFPISDNTTPEGRAQNRRISLSVRAK